MNIAAWSNSTKLWAEAGNRSHTGFALRRTHPFSSPTFMAQQPSHDRRANCAGSRVRACQRPAAFVKFFIAIIRQFRRTSDCYFFFPRRSNGFFMCEHCVFHAPRNVRGLFLPSRRSFSSLPRRRLCRRRCNYVGRTCSRCLHRYGDSNAPRNPVALDTPKDERLSNCCKIAFSSTDFD
jgi:hypothetical protein